MISHSVPEGPSLYLYSMRRDRRCGLVDLDLVIVTCCGILIVGRPRKQCFTLQCFTLEQADEQDTAD